MRARNPDPSLRVRDVLPGRHLCLTYDAPAERDAVVAAFLNGGLDRGEKVMYLGRRQSAGAVREALTARGVDVDKCTATRQLDVRAADEWYAAAGSFDPGEVIGASIASFEKAYADGFPAVCIAGDMSWALERFADLAELYAYERRIQQQVFALHPVAGLCEYEAAAFGKDAVARIRGVHPDGRLRADALWQNGSAALEPVFGRGGAMLEGELDFFNNAGLEEALRAYAQTHAGDVVVDLSGARYLDVGSMRIFIRLAAALHPKRSVVLHGTRPHVRRAMEALKWTRVPGLRLE